MKTSHQIIALLALAVCASSASARDDVADFTIASVLATDESKAILGDNIQFFFGDQSHI